MSHPYKVRLIHFVYSIILSIALFFLLARLGGDPFGHNIKFFVSALLYFILVYWFTKNQATFKHSIFISVIFLVPPFLIYGFTHILNFKDTLISLPSSLSPILGVLCAIAVRQYKVKFFAITLLLISLSGWCAVWGYDLYINYLNYNSFTGLVEEPVPEFSLYDKGENLINREVLHEKIIVLDFWTTSCGICFKKFPEVEKFSIVYKKDSVFFYAVNIPIKRDSVNQAKNIWEQLGYSFDALYARDNTTASLFNIKGYPTTFIIKNDMILYKGNVEGVDNALQRILKD